MIEFDTIITGGVGLITSVISSCVTWFLARKKYNSEVDLNLVEKMEKSLEFYKSLSDDNRIRLEEITDRNNELNTEIQELRKQVLNLTMNICMDLTCVNRVTEIARNYRKGKHKNHKVSNLSNIEHTSNNQEELKDS